MERHLEKIIAAALEDNMLDLKEHFEAAISEKVVDVIEESKVETASNFFLNEERLDEISIKKKIDTYTRAMNGYRNWPYGYGYDDSPTGYGHAKDDAEGYKRQADRIHAHIEKKYGPKVAADARRSVELDHNDRHPRSKFNSWDALEAKQDRIEQLKKDGVVKVMKGGPDKGKIGWKGIDHLKKITKKY